MKTIFLWDDPSFILSLIVLSAIIIALAVVFVKIVVIEPIKDEVPYRHWHWTWIVVRQVIPGVLLLTIIISLLVANMGAIKCKYQWDRREYQIVEGQLEQLTIDEFWRSGSQEPRYDCAFCVDGVYFPPTNDYTAEQAELLSKASYVKIYYLYDGDTPWPWRIDAATTE